jgi:hypothetical protein
MRALNRRQRQATSMATTMTNKASSKAVRRFNFI